MAEFFGRNSEFIDTEAEAYHNAFGHKRGVSPHKRKNANPLNPSRNCCGFNATGDETAPEPVSKPVMKMQAWQYAKTGLAVVGAYVVIKFLYGKFVK
jgi:hypothetical protein